MDKPNVMFLNMNSLADFQVNDILQHYPDLMNGFNEFLEHCENIGRLHISLVNFTLLDALPLFHI